MLVEGHERTLETSFVDDAPRCRQGRGRRWRRSAPARCWRVATLPQRLPRRPAAPDAAGEIGSRPRGDHRRRCGRRGRGLLSRRHPRRRPLRGEIQDRRSLRFARDRLPGAAASPSISAPSSFIPTRTPFTSRCWSSWASTILPTPTRDDTLEAPASLCIFPTAGGPPIFSSSHPFATPQRALDFVTYTQLARQAVLSDLPWETTVEAWIRSLPVEPVVQERHRVSVDHGVDRVSAGRCAAGVGAVDSADVRVGVSGRHRSGRDHIQLDDRPAGQPATPAGPQPDGAGAPQHGRARR